MESVLNARHASKSFMQVHSPSPAIRKVRRFSQSIWQHVLTSGIDSFFFLISVTVKKNMLHRRNTNAFVSEVLLQTPIGMLQKRVLGGADRFQKSYSFHEGEVIK